MFGLVTGVAVALLASDGVVTIGGSIGGDYPAFYGAGRLILEGNAERLYDWAAQEAAQAGTHPPDEAGFLPFAYPPFVALVYAPFAALPFLGGFVLYSGLLGLAVWGAVRLARPMLGPWEGGTFTLFVAALCFEPLLRSVLGGQNTAVTLLMFAWAWRELRDGRDVWAGVALGLMLYKPQFGLPLIGLAVLGGHWRVLPGAAGVAAGLYLLGAGVGGVGWPLWWLAEAGRFQDAVRGLEAANAVGSVEVMAALTGNEAAGWMLAGAIGLGLAWVWFRRLGSLDHRMALSAAGVVLMAPHALFYDAGLVALPMAVLAAGGAERRSAALLYAAAWVMPALAVLWAFAAWAAWTWKRA